MSRSLFVAAGLPVVAATILCLAAPANAQTYTTFSMSGSIVTLPVGINGRGTVTGYYTDSAQARHGFVRAADGTIATFDPDGSINTAPAGIDKNGTIVGTYETDDTVDHGFVRTADGTITSFDPNKSQDTDVTAVHGKTIGVFSVGNKVIGFQRSRGDRIEKIHYPHAKQTYPLAINGVDEIAGNYREKDLVLHGFFRASDGSFTSFDPAGATFTSPVGIDRDGTIAGYYGNGGDHGFVRTADGSISSFDVSGAIATDPAAINTDGTIVGTYTDSSEVAHGFLRDADGTLTTFNVPDSTSTEGLAINNKGVAVGVYSTASGGGAFVRAP